MENDDIESDRTSLFLPPDVHFPYYFMSFQPLSCLLEIKRRQGKGSKKIENWKHLRRFVVACAIFLAIVLPLMIYESFSKNSYSRDFPYHQIPPFSCHKDTPSQQKYVTTALDSFRNEEEFGSQMSNVFTLLGIANDTRRIPFFNSADPFLSSNLNSFCDKLPLVCETISMIPMNIKTSGVFNISSPRNINELNYLKFCGDTEFLFIQKHDTVYEHFEHINVKKLMIPTFNQEYTVNSYIHIEDLDKLIICAHTTGGPSMGDNSDFIRKFEILNLQHCPNAILYIFTNDTLWIKDITSSRKIRIYEINDTIICMFLAQKVCDEMWLTSPSSKEGWWMGYMMHNQSNVAYRSFSDEVKNSGMIYPKKWRKLGKSLKRRDLLCSTTTAMN